MAKQALGKGLGALISKPSAPAAGSTAAIAAMPAPGEAVRKVSLNEVVPSPLQPRKEFAPEHITELMESIREHGIIQPLIVRLVNGKCELIAGERRWRASRELGLTEVPVIVRTASDRDVLELALIENLQRENLNAIEEAQAYVRLAQEFNLRQEDIAKRVGKNRATVANAMRLLDLPKSVQAYLSENKLSTGHAKVLLGLKVESDLETAAAEVVTKGLTVRATEKLVEQMLKPAPPAKKEPTGTEAELLLALRAVEDKMKRHFSTAVSVSHTEKKGRIEFDYYGIDDLNRLLGMMGVEEEDFGG
jgi:ParB family transcriptional regulator, chromosome partitioning protein